MWPRIWPYRTSVLVLQDIMTEEWLLISELPFFYENDNDYESDYVCLHVLEIDIK